MISATTLIEHKCHNMTTSTHTHTHTRSGTRRHTLTHTHTLAHAYTLGRDWLMHKTNKLTRPSCYPKPSLPASAGWKLFSRLYVGHGVSCKLGQERFSARAPLVASCLQQHGDLSSLRACTILGPRIVPGIWLSHAQCEVASRSELRNEG